MKEYYKAYDERYKTIHKRGTTWSSDKSTPLVLEIIKKYGIEKQDKILEIGCGEGRDSIAVLKEGYNLTAIDVSSEAIRYCKEVFPNFKENFKVLDCLSGNCDEKYKMIFSVAVIHMLVLDEDRAKFYRFLREHLDMGGIALILSMGDGVTEIKTDEKNAFNKEMRKHPSGDIEVAATSMNMVSFETFKREIKSAKLKIIEEGITSAIPDFNSLLYAVVI